MRLLSSYFALALLAMPAAAQAQAWCGPRSTIVDKLSAQFEESLSWWGIVGDGKSVVELFTSIEKSTWTMLLTLTGGETCWVGSGMGWRTIPAPFDQKILGGDNDG